MQKPVKKSLGPLRQAFAKIHKIWDEYQVYSNDEMEHADDTIKMLNPEQEDHKT